MNEFGAIKTGKDPFILGIQSVTKVIMACNPSSSSSKVDRKTTEKNRRIQMKALYSKLHSLVPHDSPRGMVSQPDQLHEATNYIKKLQIKLEKMKEEKENLMRIKKRKGSSLGQQSTPRIDVREMGSSLEAILITGVDFQIMLSETIRVIHEEGFDVINASFSIINDIVVHTIHAQIGETYSSENNGISRIKDKLNNIVYST